MMQDFYSSPAVSTCGSEDIFQRDVAACLSEEMPVQGYVFVEDSTAAGYAMVVSAFSTEFGAPSLLVEDIYIRPEFRSRGFGRQFFEFLTASSPVVVLRLEASPGNEKALRLYTEMGFEILPYLPLARRPVV